jgi:hypothetical protein
MMRAQRSYQNMATVLWVVAALLVLFWLVGLVASLLGMFIHVILVLAVIVFIIGFLTRT